MGYPITKDQTAQPLVFLLVSSTDHITGITGASPTVTISKNGGAFAAPAGAVTPIGNGWYKVAGNAADADTFGPLLLHAEAAGSDPTDDRFDVVAYNPQAISLGLSDVAVNLTKWAGKAVAAANLDGVPKVDVVAVGGQAANSYDGTAQAGTTSTITLDTTEAASADTLTGRRITIIGGTGAGQSRIITSYEGEATRLAAVHKDWDVTPDATSKYILDATADANAALVVGERLGSKVGGNLNLFFQNAGGDTAKVVDDVGTGSGGSGAADWTTTEQAQLRYRLGIDGTATAPTTSATHLGTTDANVVSVATDAIGAAALAAAAVTKIQTGLATAATQTAIGANVASILGQTGTTGVKVADKDGYRLAPTGLDAISVADPGGVAGMNTLPKLIVALWRRQFKKTSLDASSGLQTFGDDGLTVNTAQTLTDDGTTQTIEAA
jgi:hypothetical protein